MNVQYRISKQKPVEIVELNEKNLQLYAMEQYDKVFPGGYNETTNYADTFDHLNLASFAVKYEKFVSADIPPGMYNFVEQDGELFLSQTIHDSTDYLDLKNNPATKLSVDVEKFFAHDQVFKDLKIAKKRGSLLYGPPGNGKSREVLRASQVFLEQNPTGIGLVINTMNEVWYLTYLRKERKDTPLFVVFEELTNFTDGREELHSKLLNLLDGSEGIDNIYIVATTNHPKRLSANITNRPGRFHNIIDVPNPTASLRKEFMSKFIEDKEMVTDLVKSSDEFSLAHLKEVIVYANLYKCSWKEGLKKVKDHITKVKKGFAKINETGDDGGNYI